MKKIRMTIMTTAVLMMVGAASITAYAASSYSTPAEALAGLTGRTAEDVTAERYETGKTHGMIAKDAGKLEEFQAEILQIKKDILADRVEAGVMTQERADAILSAIEENQTVCDGTGSLRAGQRMGAGFGRMNGSDQGYWQVRQGYGQCGVL